MESPASTNPSTGTPQEGVCPAQSGRPSDPSSPSAGDTITVPDRPDDAGSVRNPSGSSSDGRDQSSVKPGPRTSSRSLKTSSSSRPSPLRSAAFSIQPQLIRCGSSRRATTRARASRSRIRPGFSRALNARPISRRPSPSGSTRHIWHHPIAWTSWLRPRPSRTRMTSPSRPSSVSEDHPGRRASVNHDHLGLPVAVEVADRDLDLKRDGRGYRIRADATRAAYRP